MRKLRDSFLLSVAAVAVAGFTASAASAATEVRDPLNGGQLCEGFSCERTLTGTYTIDIDRNGIGPEATCDVTATLRVDDDGEFEIADWQASGDDLDLWANEDCGYGPERGLWETCDSSWGAAGNIVASGGGVSADTWACFYVPWGYQIVNEDPIAIELDEDGTTWTLERALFSEFDAGNYHYTHHIEAELQASDALEITETQ